MIFSKQEQKHYNTKNRSIVLNVISVN